MGVAQNLDTEIGIYFFKNPHSKSEFDGSGDGPKHQLGIPSALWFRDDTELRSQDVVEVTFGHRSEKQNLLAESEQYFRTDRRHQLVVVDGKDRMGRTIESDSASCLGPEVLPSPGTDHHEGGFEFPLHIMSDQRPAFSGGQFSTVGVVQYGIINLNRSFRNTSVEQIMQFHFDRIEPVAVAS